MGEDTRAFLAVIRSLGRAGLEVHVAWCPVNSAALQSRYIRTIHSLPDYRPDDRSWLDAFNNLCGLYRFELILPCTDGTILPFHLHRDELQFPDRICVPDRDAFVAFSNKDETYSLARNLTVPLPAQVTASTVDRIHTTADQFGFPVFLKPKASTSKDNPQARQFVQKVRRTEDVERCARQMLDRGPVLVQQNFEGIGVGVEVLCKDGEILTAFQHQRIHEPRAGGGSSYRKSVALHSAMLDATRRLMAAVRYTGVAMVEFRFSPKTRLWVLIEVNARFWGSLPLSIAAGLDFPRYLFEMLCRGRSEFPRTYHLNVYARHWSADLQWMVENLLEANCSDLNYVPWWKVAADAINITLLREHSDTWAWDDLSPAISDLKCFFRQKTFSAAKRFRFAREIRQRAVLPIASVARRVLFVCHGNICRSPFAAAIFQQCESGSATCSSFGCFPKEGRVPPSTAIQAARVFGIDLGGHRSRVLTQADIDPADLILIFDHANQEELEARFRGLSGKVHYLGALEPDLSIEIADPYGADFEDFIKCYERISRIVRTTWPPRIGEFQKPSGSYQTRISTSVSL